MMVFAKVILSVCFLGQMSIWHSSSMIYNKVRTQSKLESKAPTEQGRISAHPLIFFFLLDFITTKHLHIRFHDKFTLPDRLEKFKPRMQSHPGLVAPQAAA